MTTKMIAADSMQSFEYNKRFYRDRLEKESCPAVRRLLEQDIEWGENIEIPDDHRNCEFCVGSHLAVLDGFITEYRKAAEEQKQDFKLDL